jgi:hypothetical protein
LIVYVKGEAEADPPAARLIGGLTKSEHTRCEEMAQKLDNCDKSWSEAAKR